jgi:hypothetical protein
MIENVSFDGLGHNPSEFDYMYILKKKIDEIVDHLNLVHGDGQFHMSLPPETAWGGQCGCGISMDTAIKEEKDESKA